MAQYQITIAFHQLFLNQSQDAGVATLLEFVLNQMLQAQVRLNPKNLVPLCQRRCSGTQQEAFVYPKGWTSA
ncbi:hypothetical protein ETC00_09175 [Brevibacillus sp. MCWH]|nr:hypothetical protein [Brevibacillus sp. MCWH]